MEEGSIDLTVTSPPYDNLRNYNDSLEWNEDIWKEAIKSLYRITKNGGVVVWVVGDATVKGSETGTSFKQALWAKECGFNLHDTMIWEKTGMLPTKDRYYSIFEYMFVFSKGKPKSMNFIEDKVNQHGGRVQKKDSFDKKEQSRKTGEGTFVRKHVGRRTNIWRIATGVNPYKHSAIFPEKLAEDHIISWSNEGDTVLDCFAGSGTTGVMAKKLNRKYILIESEETYIELMKERFSK